MPNAHHPIPGSVIPGSLTKGRATIAPAVSRAGALSFALLVAIIGLFSQTALADNVVWKKTKLEEIGKAWKLNLEIHLDRAPDVPHMPVRFEFTPMSYLERALVDGRKDPVIRQVPLVNQQPIVESVDVGFLDPGTGKAAKRTRFTFEITRDRGFEAGTYEVQVTDTRNNRDLGGKATLTLDGENDVIDRRSMVFDDKPKEKKDSAPKEAKPEEKELTPDDDAFWAGGPRQAEEKTAPLPPPAHLQEKPGCGCRVGGASDATPAWALLGLGVCLLARRVRQVRPERARA